MMSELKIITVFNLETNEEFYFYDMPGREAVMTAHAQFAERDYDSAKYEERYGPKVTTGPQWICCGDWATWNA